MIVDDDIAGQKDLGAASCQTNVKFGIFVMREALIITASGGKKRGAHERMVAVINPDAPAPAPVRRSACAKGAVLSSRVCDLKPAVRVGARAHGDANAVGRCFIERLQKRCAEIFGIARVRVDADE